MGKSVRQQNPFDYKPEYNKQASASSAPTAEEDAFSFRPEYNADVKKKDGEIISEPSLNESAPTPSKSPSSAESAYNSTSFLINDVNNNDFFSQLSRQTDQFFLPATKERENKQFANATIQEVLRNPQALGRYNDNRIQTLRKKINDIDRMQGQYVEYYQPDPISAPTHVEKRIKNNSAYNQLESEKKETENYINELKGHVANIATDFVMRDKDFKNFNPVSAGREILRLADPETEKKFMVAEKDGATLPGIRKTELERIGIDAALNYASRNPQAPNSPELIQMAADLKTDFEKRNFEATGQVVREKIGAELYRQGKSGFWGYSPEELDAAAQTANLSNGEKSVFENYVKPLEKRIIGTDIPGSGFSRSFRNAIEKSAVNTGKTLGDITGLRQESEVAQELLNQEIEESRFRAPGENPATLSELGALKAKERVGKLTEEEKTRKVELEKYTDVRNGWSRFKDGVGDLTGQVAWMALSTKGLGAIGSALKASGAAGGLLGGLTRGAVGTALSNETVGLFVNSYLNSYDNYLKQGIELMPGEDQAANRDAYAKTMAGIEGLSEMIFPDTKVLKAFSSGIAPSVKDIASRFINKEITQQIAKEELQGTLKTYLKKFGKEYIKSTGQEATEEAVVEVAQGMADSIYGGQPFDIAKTGQQALNTFVTTALYSPLVAGMAAHGAYRQSNAQNAFFKSSLFNIAANPTEYLKAVEDLQLNGTINQQQANEKVKLIKSASDYLKEVPETRLATKKVGKEEVVEEVPMDYPTTNTYLLHRLNEGILQQRIDNTTDEVVKSQLNKELKRSQDIRKGIYDGSIAVTPDLREATDNPEKAQELGIADANQLQPAELIGTPFVKPVEQLDVSGGNIDNEQKDESHEKSKIIIENAINAGKMPGVFEEVAKNDPQGFLKFVADQAFGRDEKGEVIQGTEAENDVRKNYGDELVDYAKKLFPIEKDVQGVSVTFPKKTGRESTAAGVTIIKPEAKPREGVTVIQPNELSKPNIIPLKTQTDEEVSSQEAIPQEGNQEAGSQQEGQNAGQENDEKGDVLLTEQGAEPQAEAPLTEPVGEAPLSGITHEATEETRQEFGLGESYEKTAKRDEDLEKQATEEIKKGYDIEGLISKIQKGVIPTDVENTILKKYKTTLEAKISKDPSNENLDELKRLVQATDKIGSETGRALRSRQGMELRDDSLAGFFIQDINANLQAPLTEQQKETVIKEHEEIEKAQAAYDAKMAALEAENAKLRAEQALKKNKPSGKKQKKTHEDYVKERKDYIQAAKEKLAKLRGESQVTVVPYANELFAIAPEVAKVVKSLVEEGVTNLAEVTKNVYNTFKEVVPDLTETDVNNLIAGDYNEKRKTKSEIAKILRDLKDEAALINKLEALVNGQQPKEERAKIKRNQQIEALRQQIKDLKEEQANAIREEKEKQKQAEKDEKANQKEANKKTPEQTALQTLKARTKNEIDKLEQQIAFGNYDKEEQKAPLKLDKEAVELKDYLIKLRQERQVRLLRMEYANRSKIRKAFDVAANVLNVPRSLMASVDFSAPLRQAAIVTVANPKTAALAGLEMFKQAFSQKRFDRWFYDLQETNRYQLMQEAGLYVADPHDPRMSVREEQFMSNLAEKIPIVGKLVKGSERAYVSYLNKMRVDLFNRYADALENDGFTWNNHPELYEGLAKFLNNSTGRGDLGPIEVAAPLLNATFFSPRLMASRINILSLNPNYYRSLPPKIREEAILSFLKFIAVGYLTIELLKLAFGCDESDEDDKDCVAVEPDPRSSDFGKIRVGKTRWDIWGGFQQYVRIVSQLAMGQTKSVNSGAIQDLSGEGQFKKTRADQLFSFFRGKLAPVPSFVVDRLAGRNVLGQKQTLQESVLQRIIPLVASDLYTAVKENGAQAIFTQGIPSVFGVGVQNYLPQGFDDKNMKDPVYKFLYDKNINLSTPAKKEKMSDEQYQQFLKDRQPIIREEWEQAIQYGIMINEKGHPTIDEDAAVKIVPANKATYEQLTGLMKSIATKASREVLKTEEE